MPRDAIVAVNPWRGHALLYAFGSGRSCSPARRRSPRRTGSWWPTSSTWPATPLGGLVCGAVRRLGVSYVLTGGTNVLPNSGGRDQFLGIDLVPGQPGFDAIARSGPYTLWRITACS